MHYKYLCICTSDCNSDISKLQNEPWLSYVEVDSNSGIYIVLYGQFWVHTLQEREHCQAYAPSYKSALCSNALTITYIVPIYSAWLTELTMI
jgi:hypothetical protein